MRMWRLLIMIGVALAAVVQTSCVNDEEMMHNVIVVSNRYKDAEFRNGDTIALDYLFEYSSTVDVDILNRETGDILQSESISVRRGEGRMEVVLDVGNYIGACIFKLKYYYRAKEKLWSSSYAQTTGSFTIYIVE